LFSKTIDKLVFGEAEGKRARRKIRLDGSDFRARVGPVRIEPGTAAVGRTVAATMNDTWGEQSRLTFDELCPAR